ncbi:MAG: DUF4294 domain-containing protein [Bacteroidia bacterium]|nr:DUF4294 domain-containing protein [Bacteroidia bacterium]
MKFFGCFLFCWITLWATAQPQRQGEIFLAADSNGIPISFLDPVIIEGKTPTKKEREAYLKKIEAYKRYVRNIVLVYPLAKEAARILAQLNAEMAKLPTEKDREKYFRQREKELFRQYEHKLKDLTVSQGNLLVKLIDRETGSNAYSLIKDLKSGRSAFFWQTVARIFGGNLKMEYNPQEEQFIEMIIQKIENHEDLGLE